MIPVDELQAGDLVRLPMGRDLEVLRLEPGEIGLTGVAGYVIVCRAPGPGMGPGYEPYARTELSLAIRAAGSLVDARRPGGYDAAASNAGGEQTREASVSDRLADNSPPASAPTPRARPTDPGTSHAAARSIGDLRDSHEAIRRLFRELGEMSDDLLVERYQEAVAEGLRPAQSPSGIRTRRHELAEAGEIVRAGETVLPSGRRAIVWGLASRPLEVYDPEPPL